MTRRVSLTRQDGVARCAWCGSDPLYVDYHDREWGVPEHDDRALFEKLLLDGFQAGLSWIIILRKRDAFRRAFDGFDPEKVARWDSRKLAALGRDATIVRNRAKLAAAVDNARAYLSLREQGRRFSDYLWSFTGGRPRLNHRRLISQLPAETRESRAMAQNLKERGFRFCGPTICYAFMQAIGMVNDHLVDCFRHAEVTLPVPPPRR